MSALAEDVAEVGGQSEGLIWNRLTHNIAYNGDVGV